MLANPFKRLSHRLRGTPKRDARQTVKDRALALRLFQLFEQDLEVAKVEGIHFYVQNEIVTLYGTIRHSLDRDLLCDLIRQITGVKEVVEHLQIADPVMQLADEEVSIQF